MALSSAQLLKLKAVITQAPYDTMTDDEIKSALEQPVTEYRDSSLAEAERILQDADEWWEIEDAAKDSQHLVYQLARRAYSMLVARREGFNTQSATAQAVLSGLVSAGLISAESKAAIEALGEYQTSKIQKLGLGQVARIGWFEQARNL